MESLPVQRDESLPFKLMDALDDYPPIRDIENNNSYVAGIIDGEGTIYINKRKPNPRRKQYSLGYNLFVSIHNSSKPLLEWTKLMYGGSMYANAPSSTNKLMWMWVVSNKNAYLFLTKIFSYLLIKERQAALAIQFYKTCTRGKDGKGKRLTQEMLDEREYYRQSISNLNQGRT
jgi:hypothetical protein